MSYSNVGLVWTVDTFNDYLKTVERPQWCNKICLHHTAAPSLATRPKGLLAQHIVNMREYYKSLNWNSGPHLFIDEDQIWGMTPLTERGIHAVSFNSKAIGIEVLGDYDSEDPFSGRGFECWKTAALTVKCLSEWLNIPVNSNNILFHRDDPRTSKTCPGTKIKKDWLIKLINGDSVSTSKIAAVKDKEVFAGVIDYVVKNKGYTTALATSLLKRHDDGLFYFGNDWLEGAKYDSKIGYTVAPISELKEIKNNS